MKKLFLFLSATILMGSLSVCFANSQMQESKAYDTSSLPTTIDLNDCSSTTIRNYYSSLNSLSSSEKQGQNLLKNLKTVLSKNQKYYSYDSGDAIWQMYEITDRDWELSPANRITYGSYNSSTNKITNYQYGSNSSPKNDPYVHSLYTNRNVTNQAKAWGEHTQDNWGINREHLWPKSQGFASKGSGGARGDPMHLWSGNGYVNNEHSNYAYGYVGNITTNCGNKYSYVSGNYVGTSKSLGSGTVFEPQDSDKGDIARSIFYMAARYNNIAGNDTTIDQNNPNLTIDDSTDRVNKDSTASNAISIGILHDLLEWHRQDPVDQYEIHRNNLLYVNYTNNRNPFIDFPEWADYIWGTPENNMTYSSPTGYANPSSDTINGYNTSVTPTSITLSDSSIEIEEGSSYSVSISSVTPSNASKSVTWSTSNSNVATVSGGTITGVNAGSATITATSTVNSSIKASLTVTVTEKEIIETGWPYIDGIAYKYYCNINSSKYYFDGGTSSHSYYGSFDTTYGNGVYVYFENNSDGKSMYFMDGSTKKYVSIIVATSSGKTYRNFNISTSKPAYPWYYDETKNAIYAFTGDSTKYYLGRKSDSSYMNFGAYSGSSVGDLMLVEELTADVFSYKFLNKITCDSTGNTAPKFANGYSWNNFKSLYNSLNSVEQNLLLSASANANGSNIEKAMARYDFIAHKYKYDNFISRSGANSIKFFNFNNSDYSNIILIVSAISLSGLMVYLIIRKKRTK